MTLNELKMNESCVLIKTVNDSTIYSLLDFGLSSDMKVTFIGPKENSDPMFFYTDYNNR